MKSLWKAIESIETLHLIIIRISIQFNIHQIIIINLNFLYIDLGTTSINYQIQYWNNKFDKYYGSTLSNDMQLNKMLWANATDMYIGGN